MSTKEAAVTEMVDRVAFAIRESYGCEDGEDGFRACVVDYCSCRQVAREAIAAMREPTEAMIRACDWPNTDRDSSLEDVWRVMIDAALGNASPSASEPPPAPVLSPEATSAGRGDGEASQRPNLEDAS